MTMSRGPSSLCKTLMAAIAVLTLTGAAPAVTPAEALPLDRPSATSLTGPAAPGIEQAAYRRYHRWHPYHRFYGFRRYHRDGVPLPCRGRRTSLSKRYC